MQFPPVVQLCILLPSSRAMRKAVTSLACVHRPRCHPLIHIFETRLISKCSAPLERFFITPRSLGLNGTICRLCYWSVVAERALLELSVMSRLAGPPKLVGVGAETALAFLRTCFLAFSIVACRLPLFCGFCVGALRAIAFTPHRNVKEARVAVLSVSVYCI
jgi:hypothetical protein